MSGPTEAPGPGRVPQGGDPLTLLLVEDDRADAIIVEELIADAGVDSDRPNSDGGVTGMPTRPPSQDIGSARITMGNMTCAARVVSAR